MEILWWTLTVILMGLGLVGAVFPVWPDSLLILAGAALHHYTMPPEHTITWWTLGILVALTVLAHVIDFTAGAYGARKFGGTKWGSLGGILGGIVGTIFFFPIGIFLGPVVGVICAEVILARRAFGPAAKSSWGSLLGTLAGMLGKAVIDVAMIALFALAIYHGGTHASPILLAPPPALHPAQSSPSSPVPLTPR